VLCVGAPQPPAETEAQRRIGLLALEQSAWAVADTDARFSVAGSRTELDWALKGGRMVVWAPTHMAMAALGRAVPDASDPAGLAGWLAGEIGARRLVVGGAAAVGDAVPVSTPADFAELQEEDVR
jgi:dihydroneopterin aldolase